MCNIRNGRSLRVVGVGALLLTLAAGMEPLTITQAPAATRVATLHVGLRILPPGRCAPGNRTRCPLLPDIKGKTALQKVVVREGDTLTEIARRYYGNSAAFVHILESNRAVIPDPDRITPGTVLTLPMVADTPAR